MGIFWVDMFLYDLDIANIANTNMFSILTNTNIANIDMIRDLIGSGQ